MHYCRAPHGARGLKSKYFKYFDSYKARRAPHGARGLKFLLLLFPVLMVCRAPHGARGLKFANVTSFVTEAMSRPARGAWIEIYAPDYREHIT